MRLGKLTGEESILHTDNAKLIDFWQWAYSDIMNNAERGIFAEWLVTKALNSDSEVRTEWDKYDVLTPDGIRVEVKTSGYLQTWKQNGLSKLVFGIAPTLGWDKETNTYDSECKHQADVYVFCVHACKEQDNANPFDLSQWEFYVMSTAKINEHFGNQKSVTLSRLIEYGAQRCAYNDLNNAVNKAFREESL